MEFDDPVGVRRGGEREVTPHPGASAYLHTHILTGDIRHGLVELETNDGKVVEGSVVVDHGADPGGRPLLGVRRVGHGGDDQGDRVAPCALGLVGPQFGPGQIGQRRDECVCDGVVVVIGDAVLAVITSELREQRQDLVRCVQLVDDVPDGVHESVALVVHGGRKVLADIRVGGEQDGIEGSRESVLAPWGRSDGFEA